MGRIDTNIYAGRLLRLAAFLEELPPERFYYARWTACALGWATTIPEFRDLGLRLRPSDGHNEFDVGILSDPTSGPFDAAKIAFDLALVELEHLFIAGSSMCAITGAEELDASATAKQVALRIRKFVAWKYGERAGVA